MHRRLCVWVVVFGAAGSGFAQDGGEKASSRDLSDMFYANTSTSTVRKKPAPPPRVHHTGTKSDSGAAPATKPVSGPEHIGLKYHICKTLNSFFDLTEICFQIIFASVPELRPGLGRLF